MEPNGLFLGRTLGDPGAPMSVDPADLTTHGVVVGMTGSGKTGLLVGLLEECLLAGIPAVVVDPKGDLADLFLTFPDLAPADFAPWVDPEEARREGIELAELAERTAARWREGVSRDPGGVDRIRRLREGSHLRLFTPGSDAGLPVNVLSGFDPPDLDWDTQAEVIRERISAAVTALLTRAGENADPLQSPAHIFLANLFEDRWRAGEHPGLAEVLGYLIHPPFAKLGVLHVDTFYPPEKRRETVARLNALLASPSFAAWQQGPPLSMNRLLAAPAGKTPLALFHTSHLGEEDRQMFATLLLGEVIAWMRRQTGTGTLRLVVAMDEVWGLLPPHPANPPTKAPMLTLLKQARAFGVGLVVATQNPVDLDYKALTNAGFWCVGRLSTERDKARLLDGLDLGTAGSTRGEADAAISGLGPRQFLVRNVHDHGGNRVFATRWVLSYLRGPITREEVRRLVTPEDRRAWSGVSEPRAEPGPAHRDPGNAGADLSPAAAAEPTPSVHSLPAGIDVRYLEPRALQPDRPGGAVAGVRPGPPRRYRPGLLGRATVRFDEARAGLDLTRTEWRLIFPLEGAGGWRWPEGDAPDLENDLSEAPVPGVPTDALPPALEEKRTFSGLERDLKETLLAAERFELYQAPALKLYSGVGETRQAFEARVRAQVEDDADREAAGLREKFLEKRRRLEERMEKEELDVERVQGQLRARKQETLLAAGEGILGMFLGGRRSTRVLSRTRSKQRMAGTAAARLRKEEADVENARADLAALEAELERELGRIRAAHQAKAKEIRSVPVSLERNDVRVDAVMLLWVPDAAGA